MFPIALIPSAEFNIASTPSFNAYVVTDLAYLAPSTSSEACALDIFWRTVTVFPETATPFTVLKSTVFPSSAAKVIVANL